jgi:hypothetical protein
LEDRDLLEAFRLLLNERAWYKRERNQELSLLHQTIRERDQYAQAYNELKLKTQPKASTA